MSIVVVTYNSTEYLSRCLASIVGEGIELVVVDNASPSGDAELTRREFPQARLIELPRNLGFARAANIGVAAATSSWVLLLNPDAWPLEDGVERLLQFGEQNPGIAAAGPALLDPGGRPERSTLRAPLSAASLAAWAAFPGALTAAYSAWRRLSAPIRGGGVRAGEFLQGAVLLLRAEAFAQVGGFDEDFFMFGEDADLCERLRSAGWRIGLCPAARFVHVGAGSTHAEAERIYSELLRSWLRLIAKHDGLRQAERARRWLVRGLRIRAARSRDAGPRAVADWLEGVPVADLLRGPS
ncbi:MAG TPA: glycosyltransferase family 2 protein [Thermoleophilaceae bacterium]|nr:glycosyltransferase family 2 protein [Thermoleophilaceae bacterium]